MRATLLASIILLLAACSPPTDETAPDYAKAFNWADTPDRPWAGEMFWANRLQDWEVSDGKLRCIEDRAERPRRTLHHLVVRLKEGDGDLRMSVRTGMTGPDSAATGFLIGAGPDQDYRAAALIHHSTGTGAGLFAGIDATGTLFLQDLSNGDMISTGAGSVSGDVTLSVTFESAGGEGTLNMIASGDNGSSNSMTVSDLDASQLFGSLGLVSHYAQSWFNEWSISGTRTEVDPDRVLGPVVHTQYTISEDILKLTAQLTPLLPETDTYTESDLIAELQVQDAGGWSTIASAPVVMPGYTAAFRVEGWDDTRTAEYRVAIDEPSTGMRTWGGTIRADPVEQDEIEVAGFTGNHNLARGAERSPFNWTRHVWFPHNEVTKHVAIHDPDVLFFSGDQIYEGASPTSADRVKAQLDYAYKWMLFGWAFRDLMRNRPTITIPDDHDVYQGNLWGQYGRAAEVDNQGGYVMPAWWVQMIERMQTSHLPDAHDPNPIAQGIKPYYTDMTWGRVGIAIMEDRKFKHGCDGLIPGHEGRPDHIYDPAFPVATLDKPGLQLLGTEQEEFLTDWAADWTGQDMKLSVAQSIFAAMATHHGGDLQRIYVDLDSNAWPQSGRNRAVDILRRGFTFMLGGDQHLSTLVHHGIEEHGDAGYSFCVPSIANFYPRGWIPEQDGGNRAAGDPGWLGEHYDGLKHPVTVYAVTNPTSLTGVSTGVEPPELHDRMPGYGIVRFRKSDQTIEVENWPRYADPSDPSTGGQYEGWPQRIAMRDNYGRTPIGFLPTLSFPNHSDPIVRVVRESTGETEYTLRVLGNTYRPGVFMDEAHTVEIEHEATGFTKRLPGLRLSSDATSTLIVDAP